MRNPKWHRDEIILALTAIYNKVNMEKGFNECHHIKPLSELEPNSETKLSDLAMVCANGH